MSSSKTCKIWDHTRKIRHKLDVELHFFWTPVYHQTLVSLIASQVQETSPTLGGFRIQMTHHARCTTRSCHAPVCHIPTHIYLVYLALMFSITWTAGNRNFYLNSDCCWGELRNIFTCKCQCQTCNNKANGFRSQVAATKPASLDRCKQSCFMEYKVGLNILWSDTVTSAFAYAGPLSSKIFDRRAKACRNIAMSSAWSAQMSRNSMFSSKNCLGISSAQKRQIDHLFSVHFVQR